VGPPETDDGRSRQVSVQLFTLLLLRSAGKTDPMTAAAGASSVIEPRGDGMSKDELPPGLKAEHQNIHEEMVRATRVGGLTGAAAKDVAKVLFPHVLLEEEFAIPPLRLLPDLARGKVTPDMARVLSQTDLLKAELPRMLDEHKLIVQALQKLLQAASAEQHTGYARFAQKLLLHAQLEEEVLYPASILIGEYLRLKLGKPAPEND
jgi:hypothetical protein